MNAAATGKLMLAILRGGAEAVSALLAQGMQVDTRDAPGSRRS